jgi:hypothetical protein
LGLSGWGWHLDADADISKGMGRRLSPIAASTMKPIRAVRGLLVRAVTWSARNVVKPSLIRH